MATQAILLRGPAHLNPIRASESGDFDVLLSTDYPAVRAFLEKQGFRRIYKPQAYVERLQLLVFETMEVRTVELYKAERWGLGFRPARNSQVHPDPPLACLLDAVVDGKGTDYFERKQNGPPWCQPGDGAGIFGPLGRALWRKGHLGLLTLYLFLRGVIWPEFSLIVPTLCRKVAYRALRLTRKFGLEVAFLGVDGTGKTSLANALLNLSAPAKVVYIYMGPHDYRTRIMQFVIRHRLPLAVQQLAFRYDLLVRRISGWMLARRGWIVIYDRHPAERLEPRKSSFGQAVKNALDRIYAWRVDLTFWLTGAYPTIYLRKREYPAEYLQSIDQRFHSVLEHYGIPFKKIDVTKNDLDTITKLVGSEILAKYQERISIEHFPGIFRAILA